MIHLHVFESTKINLRVIRTREEAHLLDSYKRILFSF